MNRKLFSIGFVCLIVLFLIPHFVHAQIIDGPWLWMIAPTEPGQGGAASIDIDSLVIASGGAVTEADVAANGAKEGDKIGNYAWTLGKIKPFVDNNINECLNRIGLAAGDVNDHSCYALFTLRCETAWNDRTMQFHNSNDAIKVWLNGKVVHVDGDPSRFPIEFQVDFAAGDNLLMVKVNERGRDGWTMLVDTSKSQAQPTQQVRRPIVRVVYFLSKDRQPQPDINAKIDKLIKETQQLFADQMERHGYGRKTFQIETDLNGKAVVHHIVGQFTEAHYSNEPSLSYAVLNEIPKWFDFFRGGDDYYFTVADVGTGVNIVRSCSSCPTIVSGVAVGNKALVTVGTATLGTTAHELGHVFGLMHDFRGDAYIMSYSGEKDGLSKCAAEWLDVHRAFNPSINRSQLAVSTDSTVKMLPPSFVAPNAIRFRFRVTTPHGLHQAQLQTLTVTPGAAYGSPELLSYKALNGSTDTTFELVTTYLSLKNKMVSLRMIDVFGNFIGSPAFPIDLNSLLPPPQVVSIPDATLALAVRQALNLSSTQVLTTHAMLDLKDLSVDNNGITDLTGMEYAYNLNYLFLRNNNISDVSPLTGMTKLKTLILDDNNISDVSPLTGMTKLKTLYLINNNISDISSLAGMTQLDTLALEDNNISDVSPLAGTTQLEILGLSGNSISDVSPLVALNLTQLGILRNPLSYDSINTHIPAMQAKGIELLLYDNIAHPALSMVSGNGQEDFAGSVLSAPFVVEAQGADGEPMEGVSVTFTVDVGNGQPVPATMTTDADGRAQTRLMLGWTPGRNTVRVTGEGIESWAIFSAIGVKPETQIAEDVNRDGKVDVEDLVLVAATIGTTPPDGTIPNTDVNGDGVVNSDDLTSVLAALENTPTAPAAVLTAENLQRWIDEAKQLTNKDETFLKGIAVLEQLLATLLPKETILLANYPNPFNPETWVPYHLAKSAEVTVRIYAVNGTLIRVLALGHKSAGIYEHRERAVYWDGRNAEGERVASGIYFYTLTAGDFTSTRKMLIRK